MTMRCRDCDSLPKVAEAGRVQQEEGQVVQIMHNGLRVVAGGYHGDWMAHIIRGLRGHHEPQEEFLFHHLLKYVRHNTIMAELGAFWAYYTLWYLHEIPGSRAICIEPDPHHMKIGHANAQLNRMQDRIQFMEGWVGGGTATSSTMTCETTGTPRTLPSFNMERLIALAEGQMIEVLHIDAQGAETEFIASMADAAHRGQVRFVVASTHHSTISGSRTSHEDCLLSIKEMGGIILAEHDIQSSFSGDGLIVASFLKADASIELPAISRNAAANSLFPVA